MSSVADRAAAAAGDPPARRTPSRVSLRPYPDGPVVLRGPFRLVDEAGAEVRTHRRTVALCRCGRSRLGAICDGTHRSAGYRAPGGPARQVEPEVVVPLAVEGAG